MDNTIRNTIRHSRWMLPYQKVFIASIVILFSLLLFFTRSEPIGYWLEFWWIFPVMVVLALTVNTAGISGAALYVPFFILVFPLFGISLTGLESVRTGLIIESFGLLSSALAFIAFGLVDKKIAFYGIVGALPFLAVGVVVSSLLPETALFFIIAGFLMVSAALLRFEGRIHEQRTQQAKQKVVDLRQHSAVEEVLLVSRDQRQYHYHRSASGYIQRAIGYAFGGFFQGAAGFGIGEVGIISMILSRIPIRVAIGTSHLIIATTAIIASFAHVGFSFVEGGEIPWNIVIVAVPAVVLAGQLAPYVAARISEKRLERFISFLFFGIGAVIAYIAIKAYT